MTARLCICGEPLPPAPLTWGPRLFCGMACFSTWYVLRGHAGGDEAPPEYRAYADHVDGCEVCKAADREAELCKEGGALFDALDDDPTDVGVPSDL